MVTVIGLVPLSRKIRLRMLLMQELTCKIPLSAFYVEAYLLIVFAYNLEYTYSITVLGYSREYESKGSVIITGFIGLALFLAGIPPFISFLYSF